MAAFRNEGENPFASESERDNSTHSPSENNQDGDGHSDDGNGQNSHQDPYKDKPFHEHPRWKEREDEWTRRFNETEARHQEDLRLIREEFAGQRQNNREQVQIPSWFGGTQEQWDAYRADRDQEIAKAAEAAISSIEEAKTVQERAVAEATAYMQSEITAIQYDPTINPDGVKVDPNKLLKFVLDNDLVDTQGRWNYRAAFRMMQASERAGGGPSSAERKRLAGATTSESRGETQPKTFKTSADFKKSRPW